MTGKVLSLCLTQRLTDILKDEGLPLQFGFMPEQGTAPVNRYLPPRPKDQTPEFDVLAPYLEPVAEEPTGFLKWLDKTLERVS